MKPDVDEKHELPVVHKTEGPPGTGKTTRVVGNPELNLDGLFVEHLEEYSVEEQLLVTYTNAATDEAAERIYEMTDVYKYQLEDLVTTIHGQCFRLLGLEWGQTVDWKDKERFCKKYGIEFGYDDNDQDVITGDPDEGNAMFRIYGWLKSNRKELDEWEDCPVDWKWDKDPATLMREWELHKERNDLKDYSDMIEEVLEKGYEYLDKKGFGNMFEETTKSTWEMFEDACDNPLRDPDKLRGESVFIDTKVLYIDEVQDLTPLQWEWYLLQKLVVEKVYLAGDSDQTIYGWGGADPSLFINEEGETEILDRTYRVPSNIWEVCDGVIRQCDERVEKEVQPDGDGGEFVQLDCPTENEIGNLVQSGEWMVLFRANYMVDEFAKILMNEGVPYRNMSTFDNWTEDFEYLRDAMSALYHKQDRMDGDAFRAMLEYANGNMVKNEDLVSKTEEIMGKFNGIPMEKVRDTFRVVDGGTKKPLRAEPFLEASTEINYYEKEAIMGNIENKNEHLDPNKIRLGTIHSSKGKEAPNVLVGTDSTKTVLKEMRSRLRDEGSVVDVDMENRDMGMTDAERRVYYVGMTRASERLVLGHNVLDSEACIPPETLLADDHTEDKDDYEKWKQAGPQ